MRSLLGVSLLLAALASAPVAADDAFRERSKGPTENAHRGQGVGIIKELDKDGRHVILSHGEIPELAWPAVASRRLAVASPELLRGLQPGQKVEFVINDAGIIIVLRPVK